MSSEVVPVELQIDDANIGAEDGEAVMMRVDLYIAAKNGDWNSVMTDRNDMINFLTYKITDKEETSLHISAAYKQFDFARQSLNYVALDAARLKRFLESENSSGNTALCYVALTGKVEFARLMVEKYRRVRGETDDELPDLGDLKPVLVATSHGHHKMVEYLLPYTNLQGLRVEERRELFLGIIRMGLYDKALQMLEVRENEILAVAVSDSETALHVLARKPSAFIQKDPPCWRKCINFCTKASVNPLAEPSAVIRLVNKLIETAKSRREDFEADINPETVIAQTVLLATAEGNTKLVIHLLSSDPSLIWKVLSGNKSIFHIAVEKRHESIFTLIHEFGAMKDLIANYEVDGENSMLRLAAHLAPPSKLNEVSGAALQMQRQQLWFQEVKKIVQPSHRDRENLEGKTPQVLFNEKHSELRQAGEKWTKHTANSCMLVAALIATGTFAAIFSSPGGYDNVSGMPPLQHHRCFWVFSFFNATAWFSSVTSIIMFLFILTSRYAEEDFLYSLPLKLTLGVASLLISIGSMMVAFCATFLLYYPHRFVCLIGFLAVFPFLPLVYVSFNCPLLFDVIFSALRSRRMFQWPKRLP